MMSAATRSAIDAALARSDLMTAGRLALRALSGGERDVLLFQLGARLREGEGDYAAAHELLASALGLAPGNPILLTEIAAVWRRAGNPGEALKILEAMIGRGLDFAPTWLEHGYILHARGAYRDANASYRRAVLADPGSVTACAAVAETCVALNDHEAAETFARRALEGDPGNLIAQHCLAQLDFDEGRLEAARDRLSAITPAEASADDQHVRILTLLGDVLDAMDDVPSAAQAYRAANDLFRDLHAPRYGDERRGQRALIDHVREGVARCGGTWPSLSAPAPHRGKHVFLIGYPRSGTTLVENILASLEDVVALEERPTLAAMERSLLVDSDAAEQLANIDADTADRYRTQYWDSVASFSNAITGKTLVDMDPLKGIYLPIIARLFPNARTVVMRRDPREVVWSCYRHHFQITPAAYAFSSLESAARHYDALMSLTQECLKQLPLNAFVLRYDQLITDFERVTRELCTFLDLEWSEKVLYFHRTAQRRGVATASVRQVTRSLFDGRGQWRRYHKELEPVLPILQPWVERFGFDN